ncbi:MAG: HAD family hydrolase [Longimicrobiales bacterium]|nr:HAD family hydrolase [Longimicrobiales bacterium]
MSPSGPQGAEPGRRPQPAAFIDRDGTIIREKSYLADPEGVVLIPGAAEAIRDLKDAGFVVVVVTNQSGIARGLYDIEAYHAVARRVESVLTEEGAAPDATYFCPHHPDATGPCDCRKPGTGMHRQAGERFGIDYARSFYVGDKVSDVLPAAELGGQGILVRTGYGPENEDRVGADTWVVADLREAVERIIRSRGDSTSRAVGRVDPPEGLR